MREMTGVPSRRRAATRNPADRVKELDRQGVRETLVYPTLANLVEHSAAEHPELTMAIIHALNEWMLETWNFTYADRLYVTPVINCAEVDNARRELEYVLENGAKVALIKPAPVKGFRGWRSPALPEFDPFWRDVEDAGLPIVLHASQPPLEEYVEQVGAPRHQQRVRNVGVQVGRAGPPRDLRHDHQPDLPRHPDPVPETAHRQRGERQRLDPSAVPRPAVDIYKKMPQNFDEHPLDVFRRNVWVSPFWEGSVSDVVETIGWDRVMFGSDYPHPEGLAEPKGFFKYAEGMDRRRTYDFMGDNARRFLGLPIANPDPDAVKPPALAHA